MKGVWVVAGEELRDLWLRGRAGWVLLGAVIALSASAVGIAYTAQVNLLDAREGLTVLVKLALGAGLAVVLLSAADSISGERDRETLESVLLTPLDGRSLVFGKLLAVWSWGAAIFLASIPYLVVVGDSVGVSVRGMAAGAIVGLLMTPLVGLWGAIVSVRSHSNLVSIGTSALVVLVLMVPGVLPARVMAGPVGSTIEVIDPLTAALGFLDRVLAGGEPFLEVLPLLVSPVLWAVASALVLFRSAGAIALEPGV